MAPEFTSYAVAEAMFVLARSQDIVIAVKNSEQRTLEERERVERGLCRSLVLELAAFVPVSTFVLLTTVRHMLPQDWMAAPAAYGLLGMIAYAFPFVSFQKVVMMSALRTLRNFHDVLSQAERTKLDTAPKKKNRTKGQNAGGDGSGEDITESLQGLGALQGDGQTEGPEGKHGRTKKAGGVK
jgi:hypothetical protein